MKKRLSILYVLLIVSACGYGQLLSLSFDEADGSPTAIDSTSATLWPVTNNFERPERITGVAGNALRLDGWSTWLEAEDYQINGISDELTIELWYSTEAFAAANGGLVSQIGAGRGFSLEVSSFGNLIWAFHADGQFYLLVTENKIEKYQWHYIVATADLPNNRAMIYVNGEEWATQALVSHQQLTLAEESLYIGRQSNEILFDQFHLTAANGALDELRIYDEIPSATEILSRYQAGSEAIPDLLIDPAARHQDDHLRPRYHPMPNTAWANEAYGLTYYDGRYHLFFQKNPNGPYLYFMHWGHLSSPDLVNWQEEKITLAPSEFPGFDDFGVWSGTIIHNETGTPVISYTGVDGVKAGIGMAFPLDDNLINWEKSSENPVVSQAPATPLNTDFRDPYIWKNGEHYYMIIGSGLQFGSGGILFLYRSNNLTDWEELPFFFRDQDTNRSGFFWEMPFFVPLNDTDYLLGINPAPQPDQRARTLYWIGNWENEQFTPYFEDPKPFELINENLLAPAVSRDSSNRLTYIGIIPEDRAVADQIAAGWRQTFSIPRVLRRLEGNQMGHIPHPNLCRLRNELIQLSNRTIEPNTAGNLPEIRGTQTELQFRIAASSDARFAIQVYKHEDGQELTGIEFDLAEQIIALNRLQSSLSQTLEDRRQASYGFAPSDTLLVHIFLDHSTLEVFIDQLAVFSARVYPSRPESEQVDLVVEQCSVTILELNAWHLKSLGDEMEDVVCEPENLPNSFYTGIRKAAVPALSLEVYPVPSNGEVIIAHFEDQPLNDALVEIYWADGRLFERRHFNLLPEALTWQFTRPGLYLLKISGGEGTARRWIVIQ